jgi:hypothetical protein
VGGCLLCKENVACDSPIDPNQKGTREVKVSHAPSALSASFDDSSLVSCAGLVPVLELAQRCGLADLVGQRVTVPEANAPVKITGLVAGMVAGGDSIADMDLLRHGAMGRLFIGVRAPSTLGTFLRSFRFGHVRGPTETQWKSRTDRQTCHTPITANTNADQQQLGKRSIELTRWIQVKPVDTTLCIWGMCVSHHQ